MQAPLSLWERVRARVPQAATLITLFVAALIAYHRYSGASPIVWVDTFTEEHEVQKCLAGTCSLVGVSTSIPGLSHAVAWLELRTLLAWLGLGLDAVHQLVQLLNAFAAVLIFQLATRLAGRFAGAAATWILVAGLGELAVPFGALHNMSVLPFLGAVFVLACTAVIERPGVGVVALAALAGAVMANVHLACVLTGISVIWVALRARQERFLFAAFAALAFAVTAFAIAPSCWLHDVNTLLQRHRMFGSARGAVVSPANELVRWALFASGAWVMSLVSRDRTWAEYRHRSQGAFVVMIPCFAAFVLAPSFGVDANPKYLTHLRAACALAAGLPLGLATEAVLRRLLAQPLVTWVEHLIPFALALAIAVPLRLGGVAEEIRADDVRTPTIDDLAAVSHILESEHGWNIPHIFQNLRTPYGLGLLIGFKELNLVSNTVPPVQKDDDTNAVLVMVDTSELPQPLPADWKVIRRSAHVATVLVLLHSRIDWSRFEVCVQPDGKPAWPCAESQWQFNDHDPFFNLAPMPPPGVGWRGTLKLRLHLRGAAAQSSHAVFMPHMRDVCGGQVVSVPPGSSVDPDRRHATLAVSAAADEGVDTIEIEWPIGSPQCSGWAYEGIPPFFIEGDAANVRLLESILRKPEDSPS